jgi:hypothetical protein
MVAATGERRWKVMPMAKVPMPDLDDDDDATAASVRTIVKKKDFLDRVAARPGVVRDSARPVVDATLAVLAEAMLKGEEVNLPPLGKLKVVREKTGNKGPVLVLRLQPDPRQPLAEDGEAG